MKILSDSTRYGAVARLIHWLVVFGVLLQWVLVEFFETDDGSEGAEQVAGAIDTMSLHRSIGLTLLAMALLRLLWRVVDRRPEWPAAMTPVARALARVAHFALYSLLIAIPLAGWAYSSAEGDATVYFGWFHVPALVPSAGEEAAETYEELHEALFNVLVAIAALHVLAALKHHFWDKDSVLRSMLPGR